MDPHWQRSIWPKKAGCAWMKRRCGDGCSRKDYGVTHAGGNAHRRRRPRKEHFGELARYGTDPKNLDLTAKSHIRLNQSHDYTVFRIRMDDLAPETTYYYTVDSADSSGVSDGVKSSTKSFTTQ